ncbi:hypothetical protein ABC502_11790 [Alkalimonas sp. NCh-2]|uniref:hypothetical protein n=1 Tax=Alkalimonas sp. NCh-2 TaxID=3144846 RepID=UPI0031F71206
MKLNLKKSQLVNLSHDNKVLPEELTPQVGGGFDGGTIRATRDTPNQPGCPSDPFGWTNACCQIP